MIPVPFQRALDAAEPYPRLAGDTFASCVVAARVGGGAAALALAQHLVFFGVRSLDLSRLERMGREAQDAAWLACRACDAPRHLREGSINAALERRGYRD